MSVFHLGFCFVTPKRFTAVYSKGNALASKHRQPMIQYTYGSRLLMSCLRKLSIRRRANGSEFSILRGQRDLQFARTTPLTQTDALQGREATVPTDLTT